MSAEAIVGQEASQVGMICKEDAIHVPDFALGPIGTEIDARNRVQRRQLVRVGPDSNAIVKTHRQQHVNNLKTVGPRWHIDGCDVDEGVKLSSMIALEKIHDRHDAVRMYEDGEPGRGRYLHLLHILGQTLHNVFAQVAQRLLVNCKLSSCLNGCWWLEYGSARRYLL